MEEDQKPGREEKMSFTRILYKLFIPEKISFSLSDIPKAMRFISDITEGRYIDVIEENEMQKFTSLAKYINQHAELLSLVQDAINNKKKGGEVKESLLQHRVLVHSLFYNKQHILGELSRIIDELEFNVRVEEEKRKTMRVISPQTEHDLQR